MTSYEQTKAGWDNAAKSENANAAIHPAGLKGEVQYKATGEGNAMEIINCIHRMGTLQELQYFSKNPLNKSTIIDIGCGNGRVTIPLTSHFNHIYGVDFSYAMLQQLPRDTNIFPVLSVDNWFGLPESADYAFSISVFIHNTYESGVKLMQSISDNLKPGGLALLQIPVYEHARKPESWTGVGVWTSDALEHAAKVTGFEIIEMHTNRGHFDYVKNIGPNHHKFQILKKL